MKKLTLHRDISYVKSAIRLVGYCTAIMHLPLGMVLLFLAEILGVAEEAIL